jgi:hypothetical protein
LVVNWVSSCASFFLGACTAANYIFTAPTYTTTIVTLEPCALNAQFQHLLPRFNQISLLCKYHWKTGIGGESRGDRGWNRGWLMDNSIVLSISFGQIRALGCNWTYFNNLVPQHKITHISFFPTKFVCQVLDRHRFTSNSFVYCVWRQNLQLKPTRPFPMELSSWFVPRMWSFSFKVRVPQNSCLLGSHLDYCPKAKYIPHDGANLGLMNILNMLEAILIGFH